MTRAALLALVTTAALLSCGCLERTEDIVLRADGSADVTLTFRGDPGDFDALLTFPTEGWEIEKKTEKADSDDGPKERFVWTARRTFRDLNDLPACLAPAGTPHRDRLLAAATKVSTRTVAGRRVWEFERTWPQTASADLDRINDAMYNDPELKALFEKMGKTGLAALSDAETTRFFEIAAAVEFEKQMVLAERAVAAWARRHGRGFDERTLLLAKIAAAWRAPLSAPKVAEAVRTGMALPEDKRLPFVEDYLAAPRRAAIAACEEVAAVKELGGFAETFDAEDAALRSGLSVTDDTFKVRVRFPAPVLAGNGTADPADPAVATWEFGGKDLQKGAVTLRAAAAEGGR